MVEEFVAGLESAQHKVQWNYSGFEIHLADGRTSWSVKDNGTNCARIVPNSAVKFFSFEQASKYHYVGLSFYYLVKENPLGQLDQSRNDELKCDCKTCMWCCSGNCGPECQTVAYPLDVHTSKNADGWLKDASTVDMSSLGGIILSSISLACVIRSGERSSPGGNEVSE